ncbi:MAG: hypothetical protein WBQ43_03865 [Terriglobales bacterium]
METLTKDRAQCDPPRLCGTRVKILLPALLAATLILAGCGHSSPSAGGPIQLSLSGNWQFTMAPPNDGSFLGGLQGGFLLQSGNSVKGGASYAVSLPGLLIPCNIGNATVTGSSTAIGNETQWTITAVAGSQTFTLTGMESFDGSTIAGTYDSTAGTAGDGAPCGTAQTGLQWSAVLVPPLTGNILGSFHSTGGAAGLTNQDFLVSGALTQAPNTGASNATVSGTLSFAEPGTNTSDYPCLATASVYGQISGSAVNLEIVGSDQSIIGEIGEPAGSNGVTGLNPVTFDSALGGYILHSVGPSYLVATNSCLGSITNTSTAGDYGDICLSVGIPSGSANACQEPITLVPATVTLTYPPPPPATISTQTVTLANSSGGALSGLTLAFANVPATATNFTETDNCGPGGIPAQGQPFSLASGGSCVITITFTPQCGEQCSSPLTATLTVTSPESADNDTVFTVPITGTVTGEDVLPNSSNRNFQDVEHHADTN